MKTVEELDMTKQEANKALAKACEVAESRFKYPAGFGDEKILLSDDTLTLFRLCIQNDISIEYLNECVSLYSKKRSIWEYSDVFYKDHPSKESAVNSAMFRALCKLKGVEYE